MNVNTSAPPVDSPRRTYAEVSERMRPRGAGVAGMPGAPNPYAGNSLTPSADASQNAKPEVRSSIATTALARNRNTPAPIACISISCSPGAALILRRFAPQDELGNVRLTGGSAARCVFPCPTARRKASRKRVRPADAPRRLLPLVGRCRSHRSCLQALSWRSRVRKTRPTPRANSVSRYLCSCRPPVPRT